MVVLVEMGMTSALVSDLRYDCAMDLLKAGLKDILLSRTITYDTIRYVP